MSYVFDTSPLSGLFRNFYRRRFPSLWEKFDALVAEGRLMSTREVLHEIENGPVESLRDWAANHHDLFPAPNAAEGAFVARIYAVEHFQRNIEQQQILKGGRIADPFVIAKAATSNNSVVTLETFRENAARIPNICRHFGIECLSLEDFMEREGWEF